MESVPPIVQVTEESIEKVRQFYELDLKKINENLYAIEEWIKKQDHLSDSLPYISRNMLERFHILGRGSVERTKTTIDKVLTSKALLSEFILTNPSILLKGFNVFLDSLLVMPLPMVNPVDNTRICLWRNLNENFDDFDFLNFLKLATFTMEMRLRHDYVFSDRYILDLQHFKMSMIAKLNPLTVKRSEVMCTKAYGIKVKGLHVLNAPPFIDKVLNIFKSMLKDKVALRIYIHNTNEELHEQISKEVLPKDYGGDLPSCSELSENWRNYLKSEEANEIMEHSSKIVANETKRTCPRFNEEYLGLPGSFKTLNVD